MKKIICAITPNPALDVSGTVDNLKPNEKSYVHDELRSPGGNAINAARILSRLKIPVIATGFLGGSAGQEIKSLLDLEKLKHHFINIQGRTRTNVTVSNDADHQQTRLSFQGPQIKAQEKKDLFTYFEKQNDFSFLVLGGSLPKGFTTKDILKLMRISKKRGVPCVIDCPGKILKEIIPGKPLLIKPNLEEFHELTNSRVETLSGVIKKAKSLLKDVPYVCISSVEGGTLLMTQDSCFFGKIPKIKIRSTVGAGDSMVAAMVGKLHEGETNPEEILRWGLAAAAATLSQLGTTLGSAKEIHALYKKTKVQRLP